MPRKLERPNDGDTLVCTSCKQRKSILPEDSGFYRAKEGSANFRTYGGFLMPCKACSRARCAKYEPTDEQRRVARERKAQKRLSDPAFAERDRQRSARWYATARGKEIARISGAAKYAKNRHTIREAARERYRSDESVRMAVAEDTKRRRSTPEGRAAHNASNAKRKKTERGRLLGRLHAHLRRVRRDATVCDLTDEQWLALLAAYEGCCAYCGAKTIMTLDHIEALSRGGAHTLENVAPACKRCNLKKSARPLAEALVRLGVSRVEFLRRRGLALFRLRVNIAA